MGARDHCILNVHRRWDRVLVCLSDFTERKQAENEIRRLLHEDERRTGTAREADTVGSVGKACQHRRIDERRCA